MSDYTLPALPNDALLPALCRIAEGAGHLLMRVWRTTHEVIYKADESPVTQADIDADRFIVHELQALRPDILIVSEEGALSHGKSSTHFFLVDPLDGTKSFIRGGKNFTVNIGLIENGKPVAGVVLLPAHDVLYAGSSVSGAWRIRKNGAAERIHTRAVPEAGHTAVISHSHSTPETDAFLATLTIAGRSAAASSLKFCTVAEGSADLYPRFGRTMEWDTAAGQAVLEAAGGCVTTPEGAAFFYGKPGFENGNFIAWGNRRH